MLKDLEDEGAVDRRRKARAQGRPAAAGRPRRHHRPRPRRRARRRARRVGRRGHGPVAAHRRHHAAQGPARHARAGRRRPRAAPRRAPHGTATRAAMPAASSRSSPSRRRRCSASSAPSPTAAAGSCRSTRSRKGASSLVRPGDEGEAQDGDLVAADDRQARPLRPAARQGARAARLAEVREGGQPDRHPRPRHPARLSAGRRWPRRSAARAGDARRAARIGAPCPSSPSTRADAKDHDDAVHAAPDDDPANPGGFVVTVAIADVAAYVRPGSALDREALERGNSVYFPDRVVPMLPERISNDLCSLRPREPRPALAVRMIIGADGRKQQPQLPPHHDALGREALLRAGAGGDRRPTRTTTTGPLLEPVLQPLWAAYARREAGARHARAARPRPAGAQDPARSRTARSTASSCPSGSTRIG